MTESNHSVASEPLLPTTTSVDNDNAGEEEDGSILFSIVWFLLLLWIAWPVAGLATGLWVGLQPLEALLDVVQIANRMLEQVVTWPRACGQAIATGDPTFPPICNQDVAQDAADAQNDLDLQLPTAETAVGRIVCAVVWVVLLIYVAWPVAFAVGSLWVFLQPFEVLCLSHPILDGLQRLATWPRACGHAIAIGQTQVPFPPREDEFRE